MTMRLYANRKGFPLERASTTVQHEKVPDMMPPDRFTRTIVPDGPLSDDQRARILAIAGSVSRRSESHPGFGRADRALERQSGCGSREAGLTVAHTEEGERTGATAYRQWGGPRQSEQILAGGCFWGMEDLLRRARELHFDACRLHRRRNA